MDQSKRRHATLKEVFIGAQFVEAACKARTLTVKYASNSNSAKNRIAESEGKKFDSGTRCF